MLQTITQNIAGWDEQLCMRISGLNGNRMLDTVMRLLTRSGDGYLYAPAAILLLIFDPQTSLHLVLAGLAAFSIELPIQQILKHKIKRSRPFENVGGIRNLVHPPDKFSFPSGHTAAAFLMAVLVSSFYPFMTAPLFVWAAGVGISRIYNGVHYPTDVLAGLLGLAGATTGINIILYLFP